jgi:hypothetical protein
MGGGKGGNPRNETDAHDARLPELESPGFVASQILQFVTTDEP